jgi:hypothetical protein
MGRPGNSIHESSWKFMEVMKSIIFGIESSQQSQFILFEKQI